MPLECAVYYSNDIQGQNTKGGRTGSSPVIEFEHEVYSPIDEQMGTVSGARVHKALTLKKPVDTASPPLYKACCNGETLDEVRIEWYEITPAGKEELYYTTTMKNVKVASVKDILPNTKDPGLEDQVHLEVVNFLYETINWKHEAGYEYEDGWAMAQ